MNLKDRSSSSLLSWAIPNRCASGAYTSLVSMAMRIRFLAATCCRVLILCKRSANLMMITRISLAMDNNILRNVSACRSSRLNDFLPLISLILVTPLTRLAISLLKFSFRSSRVKPVSSTTSCSSPAVMVVLSILNLARIAATLRQCSK